jgi:DHA2 family multidrug resistance protein-like MFS transporter
MAMSDSETDGLPNPRRRFAMAAILVSISTATMDGVAINIALPTLAQDFGLQASETTMVVSIYQLVIVACLFPIASLSEILGYRRLYLAGISVFALAAGLNGCAVNLEMLVASRALQGLGAACVMSVNLAMLAYIVPRHKLSAAIGLNSMAVALSATLGPTLSGWLLTFAPWNLVVMTGLPFGLIALTIGLFALPESVRSVRAFDWKSAALSALTFSMSLLYINSYGYGWPIAVSFGLVVMFIGAGAMLIRRQRDMDRPLLPLDLLRQPMFSLAAATSVCAFCTQMLAYVALPFTLQINMGFKPFEAGLVLSAWPLAVALISPVAARLAPTAETGWVVATGMGILALGLLLLALLGPDGGPMDVAYRLAICGLGFGLFQSPNNRSLMAAAPRSRGSAASSTLSTARLLGQSLGTALAATALASSGGGQLSMMAGATVALLGGGLAVLRSLRYEAH